MDVQTLESYRSKLSERNTKKIYKQFLSTAANTPTNMSEPLKL